MTDKQYRQLIWVLLGRLGGRVTVSWREIGEAPRAPQVTVRATEAGFVVSRPLAGEASGYSRVVQ